MGAQGVVGGAQMVGQGVDMGIGAVGAAGSAAVSGAGMALGAGTRIDARPRRLVALGC